MEEVLKTLNSILPYVTIGLLVFCIILFIMVIVSFRAIGSLERKYKKFIRGTGNTNIEELVMSYLDKVDGAVEVSNATKEMLEKLTERVNLCVQRVSVTRYKAFEDVGSDLSFSVALLDTNNDGIILTGIYGRNDSTTYAKPIDKGISRYDLSEEEKFVLKDAMSK